MCLFTCQKCKSTINQRETGTHVCEVRADEVATDAEVLAALNSLTGLTEADLRGHSENEVTEIRAALTAAKEARHG